jgi:SAM-dependent methyltransferase
MFMKAEEFFGAIFRRFAAAVLPKTWRTASGDKIRFCRQFRQFRSLAGPEPRFPLRWDDRRPCLGDRKGTSGFDRHYFYHLAWAARVLAEARPPVHIDISSNLRFCATVSAFVPIQFYEYHPPDVALDGLTTGKADLLALPFEDASVMSLSCMHAVEHIGLGRYGDDLDPDGDLKAMNELQRVLARKGELLFVVPVGRPRLQFNAHRIYSFDQVLNGFPDLELKEFSLIPDDCGKGGIIRNPSVEMTNAQRYGCGCFWFRKE